MPDPGRALLWGRPSLTFLICTWKAAPPAGAAGCRRPEKLVRRSGNTTHIHPRGGRVRKGKPRETRLCFHRHLCFHSDSVALKYTGAWRPQVPEGHARAVLCNPEDPVFGPQEHRHSQCHSCLYPHKPCPWAQRLPSGKM